MMTVTQAIGVMDDMMVVVHVFVELGKNNINGSGEASAHVHPTYPSPPFPQCNFIVVLVRCLVRSVLLRHDTLTYGVPGLSTLCCMPEYSTCIAIHNMVVVVSSDFYRIHPYPIHSQQVNSSFVVIL